MSQEHYKKLWENVRKCLSETTSEDASIIHMNPFRDRKFLLQCLYGIYVRYGEISNQLCQVNDNTRDPKIADQSRRLLDATLSRFLQVKEEMVRAEADHYCDLNQLLAEKNTTAYDAQIRVPLYFRRDREEMVRNRELLLEKARVLIQADNAEDEIGQQEQQRDDPYAYSYEPSIAEEVVEEKRREDSTVIVKEQFSVSQKKFAPLIHRALSKYSQRMEYLKFIGMEPDPSKKAEIYEKDSEATEKSFEMRKKLEELTEAERSRLKAKFIHRFGDQVKEGLIEETTAWYTEFYKITNEFPSLPPPVYAIGRTMGVPKGLREEFMAEHFPPPLEDYPRKPLALKLAGVPQYGGSALAQSGYWIDAIEHLLITAEKKQKGKNQAKDNQKDEEKALTKKKTLSAFEYNLKPSECIPVVKRIEEEIRSAERNSAFAKELEVLKGSVGAEVSFEIRQEVDKTVKKELVLLAKTTGKKQKGSKEKKNKMKKLKKLNMMMLKDLVKHGVLHEGQGSKLSDYRGERRVLVSSPGDIIDLILAYCIMPMGSSNIHQLAPLTKSICLVGPEHSGKQFLADAIVTELDATLFEISPEHLIGLYEDSQQLNFLAKSISAVARELQPSVVLVKNVEKVFYSKVPEAEKGMLPLRLQSVLKKITKDIKPDAQIMVVGTSSFPWLAKAKPMFAAFNKIVAMPSPTYGTYTAEWKRFFQEAGIPLNHIPFANLAASQNWEPRCGIIEFNQLITDDEIERKDNGQRLSNVLANMSLPSKCNKHDQFLSKTPLGKKKATLT